MAEKPRRRKTGCMITWCPFIVHGIFASEKKETLGSREGVWGRGELRTCKEPFGRQNEKSNNLCRETSEFGVRGPLEGKGGGAVSVLECTILVFVSIT